MNTSLSPMLTTGAVHSFDAVARVLPILLDAALKGSVILALAAGAARLLARHSAASRHAVWTVAVAAQLALPALSLFMPSWNVSVLPEPEWVRTIAPPSTAAAPAASTTPAPTLAPETVPAISAAPATTPAIAATPTPAPEATPSETMPAAAPALAPTAENEVAPAQSTARTWIAAFWIGGLMLVLLRLASGTVAVARLANEGERVDDGQWLSLVQRIAGRIGIMRPLTLLRGDRIAVPVTWGIVYPVVLLPTDADQWTDERRQFVLVHEMAHVKRLDALTQLIGQFALALFWFNPLVWMAVRRMRAEREHACDDYVLRDGTRASLYADELLHMVRTLGETRREAAAPAFAALAMARRSEFEGRMLAILDSRLERRTLSRTASIATTVLALVLVLPLAAMRPFQAKVATAHPALATHAATAAATSPVSSLNHVLDGPSAAVTEALSSASASLTTTAHKLQGIATALPRIPGGASCDDATMLRTKGSSIQAYAGGGEDGRHVNYQFVSGAGGRCLQAIVSGDVQFTDDEGDIAKMAQSASAFFHERTATQQRTLRVVSNAQGALVREYTENGKAAEFDADARSWLASIIPEVMREGGFDVSARVARFRKKGGVPAVLSEIDRIRSTGGKRSYYTELLENSNLSDSDIDRIVRQAGRDLASSSGDLSAVLAKLTPAQAAKATTPVATAIGNISSDGDRRRVIASFTSGGTNRDLALVALKATAGMSSDGDKSAVLLQALPSALTSRDDSLRIAFFRAVRTISSSGDRERVLKRALDFTRGNPDAFHDAMLATRGITSDGDRKAVLVKAVDVAHGAPELTQDLLRTAKDISSDSDKSAVLIAAIRGGLITTPQLRSDLVAVTKSISSDYSFRAVMTALLGAEETK